MLFELDLSEFERVGILRLPGAVGAADAARMRDRVWEALGRDGIRPDEPATWTVGQPTGFQSLTRAGSFDALGGTVVRGALDVLFGTDGWARPAHWGVPLVTFPGTQSPWDVPSMQWHLDFPARGPGQPLFAVRVLAFLDRVAPRAGGTLVLAGSHRLVERLAATGGARGGHSRDVCRALMRSSAWLGELWSRDRGADRIQRFMVQGAVIDGVAIAVRELTGEPGDVVLMHPWQLHAPAPNRGTAPRLMLSHSVFRARPGGTHAARANRGGNASASSVTSARSAAGSPRDSG